MVKKLKKYKNHLLANAIQMNNEAGIKSKNIPALFPSKPVQVFFSYESNVNGLRLLYI